MPRKISPATQPKNLKPGWALPLLILLLLACQFDWRVKETVVVTATPNAIGTITALVTANSQLSAELATANARLEMALQRQIEPLPQPTLPQLRCPAPPPSPLRPRRRRSTRW
jgi:hypothetical protein